MRVLVEQISKVFRDRAGHEVVALEEVDLTVEPEEFVAILDPSGCGKSTLLNIIAGLLPPTSGRVVFEGERHPGSLLTATVFQEFALFPWRTVRANVEFGLEELGVGAAARVEAMAAMMEALKGKQVDAILLPQPFPGAAEAQGFGKILAWASDLYPWQVATVFYSKRFAADRERAVAFMRGYVKASRYYHDACLVQRDGRLVPGANYEGVVAITAKYTGAKPEIIKVGFPYQDRNGRLLLTDIERQMRWWKDNGFIKSVLPLRKIVDTSYLEEAVHGLGD
jgi:ABC-type sugar transport system ATPase subunit